MKALVAVYWKSSKSEQKDNLWTELENYLCCVLYCSKSLGICVHISVKAEPGNPGLPLCTLQKHHCDFTGRMRKNYHKFHDWLPVWRRMKNGWLPARSTGFSPDCRLSFCIIPSLKLSSPSLTSWLAWMLLCHAVGECCFTLSGLDPQGS